MDYKIYIYDPPKLDQLGSTVLFQAVCSGTLYDSDPDPTPYTNEITDKGEKVYSLGVDTANQTITVVLYAKNNSAAEWNRLFEFVYYTFYIYFSGDLSVSANFIGSTNTPTTTPTKTTPTTIPPVQSTNPINVTTSPVVNNPISTEPTPSNSVWYTELESLLGSAGISLGTAAAAIVVLLILKNR